MVKLPGVGKKTAERLVVEMRDRLQQWSSATPATDAAPIDFGDMQSTLVSHSPRDDALSALLALGYKPAQAEKAVAQALKADDGASSEQLIRTALKNM